MRIARTAHSGLPRISTHTDGELLFERGVGGEVIDVLGDLYTDFVLGYGSVVLGHGEENFTKSVSDGVRSGTMFPGYSTHHEVLLDLLFGGAPGEVAAAFFKTGSEAVTGALRLAARQTSKRGVVRCGFVGWHDVGLARSVRWHEPLHSPLRGVERYEVGFRGVSGNEAVLNWSSLNLEDLTSILDQHEDILGAFILDAYQARFCGGGVLKEALELCKRRGLITILDNTKLAGRLGPLGEITGAHLQGDLEIIGKAIGNGLPISILHGPPALMSHCEEMRITGTFSSEISSIHGAISCLNTMRAIDGYERLREAGRRIVTELRSAISDTELTGHIAADEIFGGAMFEITFGDDLIGNWSQREQLRRHFAGHGILILQGHCSYPCIDHANLDWTRVGERLRSGLESWRGRLIP